MSLCSLFFYFIQLIKQLNWGRLILWKLIAACVVVSLFGGPPVISMAASVNITNGKCGDKDLSFENIYRTFIQEAITVKVADIPRRFPDVDFINVIKSIHGYLDLNKASPNTYVSIVLSSQNECLQDYLKYIYNKYDLGTNPFTAKISHPSKQNLNALDKKFLLILSDKMKMDGFSWSSEKNLTYFTLPLFSEAELKESLHSLELQLSQEILHEFYIQRDVLQNIGNGYAVDDELALEKKLGLTPKQIQLLIHPCSRTALAQYRAAQFEMQKLSPSATIKSKPSLSCAQIVAQYDPTSITSFFDLLIEKIADSNFIAEAKKKSDSSINQWMEVLTKLDQLYYDQRSMSFIEYNMNRLYLDYQLDNLRTQYKLEFAKKYQTKNHSCQAIARKIEQTDLPEEVCTQLKTPTLIDELDDIFLMTMGPRCAACASGSHMPDSSGLGEP